MEVLHLTSRFWEQVNQDGPIPKYYPHLGPCWLWTGKLDQNGYANRTTVNGVKDSPHRLAYRALVGPIPDELEIDHLCCVRHCVNPAHMDAVTHALNTERRVIYKTHCKSGHPLSGDNLRIDPRTGTRHCRICNAQRQRELHAKRRAANLKPPADARCKWGHPYSVDAQGRWFCRPCRNKRQREWKDRQKDRKQG